tara:strand:- start:1426 stop:1662 length:237 start_codon:yes stop_codon:yes gene_type:complete
MEPFLKRRINIASYWSASRIALLDSAERYEDSYAITQEFREWITCNNFEADHLKDSVLKFPQDFLETDNLEKDEILEL